MASGRSSPLRAFKQPVSPKMESSLQQRLRAQRQQTNAGSLRLPGLPRFHPANFPSSHSSMANTPTSGVDSPQPPVSPRAQQRYYSDAQRQLLNYQRDVMAHKRTASGQKPTSPRLVPMAGSPGPMTPLELEAESYLTAGSGATSQTAQAEYVDKLIREQAARHREVSPSPHSPRRETPAVGSY